MRAFGLVCLCLVLSAHGAIAAGLSALNGPAAATIRSHLSHTRDDCPSDSSKRCPLASLVLDARISYGRFPGDQRSIAAVFLAIDSGGSIPNRVVYVWAAAPSAPFMLIGSADAPGENPREVRFEDGGAIRYLATVMRDGDPYCCPTGTGRFRLQVDAGKVRLVGPDKGAASTASPPPGGASDVVAAMLRLDDGSWGKLFADKPTAPMRLYFTRDFNRSWAAALSRHREPFIDGDPVTGWQGVSAIAARSMQVRADGQDKAVVTATATVTTDGGKKPETIAFMLKREDGVWKIDDIGNRSQPSIRAYFLKP